MAEQGHMLYTEHSQSVDEICKKLIQVYTSNDTCTNFNHQINSLSDLSESVVKTRTNPLSDTSVRLLIWSLKLVHVQQRNVR